MLQFLARRRRAMLEAEAIVYNGDACALACAQVFAESGSVPPVERMHHQRVVRIVSRRQALSDAVDGATRRDLHEEWRCRRGSMIR